MQVVRTWDIGPFESQCPKGKVNRKTTDLQKWFLCGSDTRDSERQTYSSGSLYEFVVLLFTQKCKVTNKIFERMTATLVSIFSSATTVYVTKTEHQHIFFISIMIFLTFTLLHVILSFQIHIQMLNH